MPFKPGQSGNIKGKPKGTKNGLSAYRSVFSNDEDLVSLTDQLIRILKLIELRIKFLKLENENTDKHYIEIFKRCYKLTYPSIEQIIELRQKIKLKRKIYETTRAINTSGNNDRTV